jgi:hypothetical protein
MVKSRRSRWKSRSTPNANGYSCSPPRSGYRCHKRRHHHLSSLCFFHSLGIASSTGIQHLLWHFHRHYFIIIGSHSLFLVSRMALPASTTLSYIIHQSACSRSRFRFCSRFVFLAFPCCFIHFAWHRPAATSWRTHHNDDDDQ